MVFLWMVFIDFKKIINDVEVINLAVIKEKGIQ